MTNHGLSVFENPMLRNSERSEFKRCGAAWNWRYNEWLKPAMPRQDARWFGTCWHLLWATVYTPPEGSDGFVRSIVEPSEIHALWDKICGEAYTSVSGGRYFSEEDEVEYFDAVKLGHFMIDGQLKMWNLDPGWEVIQPEMRFRAGIPFNKRQKDLPLSYWVNLGFPRGSRVGGNIVTGVGTFDIIIRDHTAPGKPVIKCVDWKSTNKRVNLKSNNKDDQLGMYISIANSFLHAKELIEKDEWCEWFEFSFARKSMPPDPDKVDDQGRIRNLPKKEHYQTALRENGIIGPEFNAPLDKYKEIADKAGLKIYGEISKNQGAPLFWREPVKRNRANRRRQISRISDDAEAMAAVRAGIAPILKNPGEHCNWCDYNDLCDIDEDGGDVEVFKRDVFIKSDPYADHRPGAINSKESVLK